MLIRNSRLIDDFIVVSGISRAGKFLLGSILSSLEGVEAPKMHQALESLLSLVHINAIDKSVGIALAQQIVDVMAFETVTARNVNMRKDDISSVYKTTNAQSYFARGDKPVQEVVSLLNDGTIVPLLIWHELLCYMPLFFEAFPHAKVINVIRHPADIAYSWFKRGWGKRFGVDPLAFQLTVSTNDGQVPWFAHEWKSSYTGMGEVDRIIHSLAYIQKYEKKSLHTLNPEQKKNLMFIDYETIVGKTQESIKQVMTFLKRAQTDRLAETLQRERCPRVINEEDRAEKREELFSHMSKESQTLLEALEDAYMKQRKEVCDA